MSETREWMCRIPESIEDSEAARFWASSVPPEWEPDGEPELRAHHPATINGEPIFGDTTPLRVVTGMVKPRV